MNDHGDAAATWPARDPDTPAPRARALLEEALAPRAAHIVYSDRLQVHIHRDCPGQHGVGSFDTGECSGCGLPLEVDTDPLVRAALDALRSIPEVPSPRPTATPHADGPPTPCPACFFHQPGRCHERAWHGPPPPGGHDLTPGHAAACPPHVRRRRAPEETP